MELLLGFRLLSRAPAILLVTTHNSSKARTELQLLLFSDSIRPRSLPLGQCKAATTASTKPGHGIPNRISRFSRDTNFSCTVSHDQEGQMLSASTGWSLRNHRNSSPRRSRNSWTDTIRNRECASRREDGIDVRNHELSTLSGEGATAAGEDSTEQNVTKSSSNDKRWDEEIPAEDAKFLATIQTRYNLVRVLEISKACDHPMAGARVLLLDKFGNVHSVYHEYRLLTDSYYDIFPSLPAIIPDGPIAILGLAAGTAARIIHHFWPEIDMYGWELDPAVVFVARKYFGLEELEWSEGSDASEAVKLRQGFIESGCYRRWKKSNYSVFMENAETHRPKGRLRVIVGDALSREVSVEGGFAGIIVDLFADGAVIPALQEPGVWREMKKKLQPGGRIMVNCGGSCVDAGEGNKDGRVTMEETIAAMAKEFPGELSILSLRRRGDNHIALTGPLPDLQAWCRSLPECLRNGCENWVTFESRQSHRGHQTDSK
ncbi:hypothetical protein R1flu_018358 [Riccia fluitans]|uniref:S-adenosyl-L-methionine-dependent methyltransferase n=1 Tax=Riccia fluitans TaxID=41844 RepID=A0ABD1ZFW9_9MARC